MTVLAGLVIEVIEGETTVAVVEVPDDEAVAVVEVETGGPQGPPGNDNLILLEAGEGAGDIGPEVLHETIVFRKA